MQISTGCSIQDYFSQFDFHKYSLINIEDPLFPGYLEKDTKADIEILRNKVRPRRLLLDGPYIDLNMGSPEPVCRRLAQEKVLTALAYARDCQAEEMIFLSTFLPFIGLDVYERNWIETSIESWLSVCQAKLLQESATRISLCITFEFTPDNLIEIVETIRQPNLGLAFDVGHCLVWGKLDVIDWYRQIREYCKVVYLHSNNRKVDTHESIRKGSVFEEDLLARLAPELREDCILILKYFDKAGVTADIEYLRGQFSIT